MTNRKQIFFNVMATYGRSLLALAAGIFTSRWVLIVLGDTGYGLFVLVAGLAAVAAFANLVLAGTTTRYLGVAVGIGDTSNLRAWFKASVILHGGAALLLVVVGYPVAEVAVRYWLTVPAERIEACVWMLRWVFLTSLASIINTPCQAMFAAKGRLAETSVWGMTYIVTNVVVLGWMVKHPGDWMVTYVAILFGAVVVSEGAVFLRAITLYPECRIGKGPLFNRDRIRQMLQFSWWRLWGEIGPLTSVQGVSILVNKMFGPVYNASGGLARVVATHTDALAQAVANTFTPILANLHGGGERHSFVQMAYRSSFLSLFMFLLFALPLSVEIEAIFELWLKQIPPQMVAAARLLLVSAAFDETARGFVQAVAARGRVAKFYVLTGLIQATCLPIGWLCVYRGWGKFPTIFIVVAATHAVCAVVSAKMADQRVGTDWRVWLLQVVSPVTVAALTALGMGLGFRMWLHDFSWIRIIVSCGVTMTVFVTLSIGFGWRWLDWRRNEDSAYRAGT